MKQLHRFLKTFTEDHRPLARAIIVHGGGWSAFKQKKTHPKGFSQEQWFAFWRDEVKTKPLMYYYVNKYGSPKGFSPDWGAMKSAVPNIESMVISHIEERRKKWSVNKKS